MQCSAGWGHMSDPGQWSLETPESRSCSRGHYCYCGEWSIHIGIHLAITKPTPEPYHIVYQMEHVQ